MTPGTCIKSNLCHFWATSNRTAKLMTVFKQVSRSTPSPVADITILLPSDKYRGSESSYNTKRKTCWYPVFEKIQAINDGFVPDFSLSVEARQLFRGRKHRGTVSTREDLSEHLRQALTASAAVNVTLIWKLSFCVLFHLSKKTLNHLPMDTSYVQHTYLCNKYKLFTT